MTREQKYLSERKHIKHVRKYAGTSNFKDILKDHMINGLDYNHPPELQKLLEYIFPTTCMPEMRGVPLVNATLDYEENKINIEVKIPIHITVTTGFDFGDK